MRVKQILVFAILLSGGMAACQSAPRSSDQITELKNISGFYFPTLRLRRPQTAAADPQAFPGEKGFTSKVLPDDRMDCRKPEEIFTESATEAESDGELHKCLLSLADAKPFDVVYRLDFKDPMRFVIVQDKDHPIPECLARSLPWIAVPREIVFQTSEGPGQRVDCYAAKLAYEQDLFLGLWELHPVDLKIAFPLGRVPEAGAEIRAQKVAWALAPFWRDQMRFFRSRLMSDALCEKCVGREAMIPSVGGGRPEIWPP